MNSKYRQFMQRQQTSKLLDDRNANEGSMRQLFGDSPDNKKLPPIYQPKKKKNRNVEDLPIPIKEGLIKKGFIVISVMLLIEAIFLIGFSATPLYAIGGILMAVLSFLISRKVHYKYTNESNFYLYNFSVTLKGVVNHYRTTSILSEASEKIFIYSIALMAIQQLLLSSWFSLSSILYSVGYYGMFLGIILNLAKRKTELIYKGLFLYSLLLLIETVLNSFWMKYVNYNTTLSLFLFWYLAGFFQSLKITEVHIDNTEEKEEEKEEDIEIDMDEKDEDNLI